jgi:hypothetical protein
MKNLDEAMKATQGKPMVLISSLLTLGTILEAPTLPVTAAPPNQSGLMPLSERRRAAEQTEVVLLGPSWCASTVGGGMDAGNLSTEIGKLAA